MSDYDEDMFTAAVKAYGDCIGDEGCFDATKNKLTQTFDLNDVAATELTQKALDDWTDAYCD
ncbi:MAG: hypothetical protein COA84_13690 [Robiginitomaculum sp.]|nr:MAG: hypothetical protein COA84_13690 [Robiginitomaculum sp.]